MDLSALKRDATKQAAAAIYRMEAVLRGERRPEAGSKSDAVATEYRDRFKYERSSKAAVSGETRHGAST